MFSSRPNVFELAPKHKSADQAVSGSWLPLQTARVKRRRRGDKRCRHETGSLKRGGRKNRGNWKLLIPLESPRAFEGRGGEGQNDDARRRLASIGQPVNAIHYNVA